MCFFFPKTVSKPLKRVLLDVQLLFQYAERHDAMSFMLSGIKLSVDNLSVIKLSVVLLSVIRLA